MKVQHPVSRHVGPRQGMFIPMPDNKMSHEYEFRLAVVDRDENRVASVLQQIATMFNTKISSEKVYYAKPNFRLRRNILETKRQIDIQSVYHDGFWFKWVYSIETPFHFWTKKTHELFVNGIGNAQDSFKIQVRQYITLDNQTKIYYFQDDEQRFRLLFEWEYGLFPEPLKDTCGAEWIANLSRYRQVYTLFKDFEAVITEQFETLHRKPVESIAQAPVLPDPSLVVAHKWDGTFGIIYSYKDKLKEKWEGHRRFTHYGITIGNGLVFAAERLSKVIVLLDVYQVGNAPTASWCRRAILTEFLPSIRETLPPGYQVQEYRNVIIDLSPPTLNTDGYIYHNVKRDVIFKLKTKHSIDVQYRDGYFWLPSLGKRFQCIDSIRNMRNYCIYEVSADDGRIVRIRRDRFTGNTMNQIKKVFQCNSLGWSGPPLEDIPEEKREKKRVPAKKVAK